MKTIKYLKIIAGLILPFFVLLSCSNPNPNEDQEDEQPSATAAPKSPADSMDLLQTANAIVELLSKENYRGIAKYIAKEGLTFSPYSYLDSSSVNLSKDSFLLALDSGSFFMWGLTDGKVDSIRMDLENYFENYVYDTNFVKADTVSINSFVGTGNTINNIKESFPEAEFIEYHFVGSEIYAKMNWKSLILVFRKEEGHYHLRAIVHNEWTI